jgi:hypothetical protein
MNPILNKYEELTYSRLSEVSQQNGAHVFAKIRIADVFPITGSGISDADYTFALKSHFDFIVTDRTYNPVFAVEFDGPLHRDQPQRERDHRKDSLSDRFDFPLLRINSNYIDRQFRGLDLLTYFIEVWFMTVAFDEAQARGEVPYDADFDPALIIRDPKRKERWPYWLSVDLQVRLMKLFQSGRIHDDLPSYWIGTDQWGRYRCLAWLNVTADSYVIVETGMRAHRFPVFIPDILSQIAIFEVCVELEHVLTGAMEPESRHVLDELRRFFHTNFEMRNSS